MLIYLTNVGSGKTLNFPIGNKKYDGIIGIIQKSKEFGLKYKKSEIDQDKHFNLIYKNSNFKVKELVYLNADDTIYEIGFKILSKISEIKNATFHIETSQSYKKLGQILTILSQLIYKKVEKLSFTDSEENMEILPVIGLRLTKNQIEVLKNYYEGSKNINWKGKISRNEYVFNYKGHRNYLYRIINELKSLGLIDSETNRVTDFGKLYIVLKKSNYI